jgi:hypothetical protein
LQFVGIDKIVQLLNVDANAELFEDILKLLISSEESPVTENSQETNEGVDVHAWDALSWLRQLSGLVKFKLLCQFLDKYVKSEIQKKITSFPPSPEHTDLCEKFN